MKDLEKIGDEDDDITDLGHKKDLPSPSLSKPGIESDYELVYRNAEYQIRPSLVDKFKSLSVKEIIHGIMYEELNGKVYDPEESVQWIKNIVMNVKEGVKELGFKRYKLIVQTILGQNKGSGVKVGARCLWDADADNYASDNFVNNTIFCCVIVFGIYCY